MLKLSSAYFLKRRWTHSLVNVWNEWDPLEEVIVGVPDNAIIPPLTIEAKSCILPHMWSFFSENNGKLWSEVLGEKFWSSLLEEHKTFVDVLKSEGVKVVHPTPQNFSEKYKIYGHETTGMYCAMPRDLILTVGQEIIEATMTWRSRYFEINSYRKLIEHYWRNGASWVAAPKPTYKSLLVEQTPENMFVTTESELTFDAADFVRCGADVFGQRSQVTNDAGIHWVRTHLAKQGIRVTKLSFHDPRPMHIDSTFLPLKPGYILGNPDRKCDQYKHFVDAGWTILDVPARVHKTDHPYYLASPWITMNILMLNENTAIVEAEDLEFQKMLRNLNVRVIPLKFRHCNSIGGGFHCWTVEIRRRGVKQSYFNWKPDFYL